MVAFLADAQHVPDWAPGFADTVTTDDGTRWTATKDGRDFSLRIAVSEDARIVDYLRETGPGREGGAFLRAMPRPGGGTVIVMTVPLLPNTAFGDIAATLADELNSWYSC